MSDSKQREAAGKMRLDSLVVARGLAEDQEKARRLILAGEVMVGQRKVDKPGMRVSAEAAVSLLKKPRFVSRGGMKLEAKLNKFFTMAPKAYMYEGYDVKKGKDVNVTKHKGVRNAERLHDTLPVGMLEYYYKYKTALRNEVDVYSRRTPRKDREHDFTKQKRKLHGDVKTCIYYHELYVNGVTSYVTSEPRRKG